MAARHVSIDAVTVHAHRVDGELTNYDRAAMAAPLLDAFHQFYYHHPDGEPLATVMADLIGDLGHAFDALAPEDRDDHDSFWSVLERAHNYYEDEVEEAAFDDGEDSDG